MSESIKTVIFVGVAALALAVAWLTRPAPFYDAPEADLGTDLFADFTDPLSAQSLEIIKYDEDQGALEPFMVAKVDDVWSIPSHQNYPADAADHLKTAATALIGVEKLDIVSDSASDHATFGVIEPEPGKLTLGTEGVGTRVTLKDKDDGVLASLVIGKEDPDQASVRYVRKPGQDRVYAVALDTSKFTTRFEDWIEEDLLKLSPFDIEEIVVKDYSIDELRGAINQRGQLTIDYDNKEGKWTLKELQEFVNGEYATRPLAEDEELDTTLLNDLKTALDDLKIVDVVRKPPGLSDTLRTDEELLNSDQEAMMQLQRRGFFVAPIGDNPPEIYSNEGEVVCGMKSGVEYVLRFGEIAGIGAKSETTEPPAEGDEAGVAEEEDTLNRYLMVAARFNEDLIPKPELEPLPEAPADEAQPAESTETPAAETPAEGETTEGDKPADAESPSDTADEPAAEGPALEGEAPDTDDPDAENSEAPQEDAASPETESESEPAQPAADAETSADKPESDAEEKPESELEAERKRIEAANKRKLDEYEAKVKEGQEKVKELNDRFADWYYVIADDTYKKIHLGRDKLITKVEKPEGEGDRVEDFDALKELPQN